MSDRKLNLLVNFVGVDKLSGSLKSIMGLGKKAGGTLRDMKREASRLERELSGVRGELKNASGNVSDLANRERQLQAALDKTNDQLERQKKGLGRLAQAERMSARGDALQSSGRDHMVGGATMLAPFVLLGKTAMDADKNLALVAQKWDINRSQAAKFGQAMRVAAADSKQMYSTMIEGADFLAGKGLGQKQVTAMMPVIGRFATAWDADVNDAAKATYANFNSLKVPLDQTSRALEIMAAAGKSGGFEVKDMAQYFPALTSQMATFGSKGVSAVGDLSAALQVLEANEGDGGRAANNLANMMRFVQGEQGIKKFKSFGIDIVAELKKAAKDGESPLQRIAELTEKATGGDASKISLLFTDAQAAAGARALTQSMSDYIKIRDEAMGSSGLTNKEFARMSATSAANWAATKGGLQGLAVSLGTHLLPLVNAALPKITAFVNNLGKWADQNPKTASTIMMIVGGIGAFRVGLGATQYLFGGWLKGAAGVFKFFSATNAAGVSRMARVMGGAAKVFGVVRTATMFLAKGVMRAGLMMMANPMVAAIVLIGAAIGVAAYLVYQNWDKIKAAFYSGVAALGQAWEWIKQKFNAGMSWLGALPSRMWTIGKNIIMGIVNGIKSAPGAVWSALKGIVMRGVNGIKDFLGIKSPSRLFMSFGAYTTEGMRIGIDRGERATVDRMRKMAQRVGAAGALAVAGPAFAGAGPMAAPMAGSIGSGTAASITSGPITIQIQAAPGQSPQSIAEAVRAELEAHQRRQASRARSAYDDEI